MASSNLAAVMGPTADAFDLFQNKLYIQGVLYKKNVTSADGQPFAVKAWTPWFVELCGPVLVFWNLTHMPPETIDLLRTNSEEAHQLLTTIKANNTPNFMNITDCLVHVVGRLKKRDAIFSLNSSGANFFYYQAPSHREMLTWVIALRLLGFEVAKLYENYTLTYLTCSYSALLQQSAAGSVVRQGYLQARFTGSLDWQQFWVVLRSAPDTPPQLQFYPANQPGGTPLATITAIQHAYAIYPEKVDLVDMATIAKVEATFTAHEPDSISLATTLHFALIMAPTAQELFSWIVGLYDAFGLYGRPHSLRNSQSFNPNILYLDPRDPITQEVQVEDAPPMLTRAIFEELYQETYGAPTYTSPIQPTTAPPAGSTARTKHRTSQPLASESDDDDNDYNNSDAPPFQNHNARQNAASQPLLPPVPSASASFLPPPPPSGSSLLDLDNSIKEISQRATALTISGSTTKPVDSGASSPTDMAVQTPSAKPTATKGRKKAARTKVARPVDSESSDDEGHSDPTPTVKPAYPNQPVRTHSDNTLNAYQHPSAMSGEAAPGGAPRFSQIPNRNSHRDSSETSSSSHLSWGKMNPQTQASLAQDGFDQPQAAPVLQTPPAFQPMPNGYPGGMAGPFTPGMDPNNPAGRTSYMAPQGYPGAPMFAGAAPPGAYGPGMVATPGAPYPPIGFSPFTGGPISMYDPSGGGLYARVW
ncbi:hypothetical protein BJ085DRAFT_38002 [Dimargaris cristalligena]|uniref:PH domain-containing protein n=1 Tax=Dimargaris cristalligena TaxID=215637 RepID=A0A4P9ZZE5_9FUNG|nr:hypothetical protein BJ085DRAFT_38002 [Dimargaris cristalligena]|eukprot:RKP39146.1 hypothetical protein BJ085DRAFT_38002 [Dimargaris cristalligena]